MRHNANQNNYPGLEEIHMKRGNNGIMAAVMVLRYTM